MSLRREQFGRMLARMATAAAVVLLATTTTARTARAGEERMLCDFESPDAMQVIEGRAKRLAGGCFRNADARSEVGGLYEKRLTTGKSLQIGEDGGAVLVEAAALEGAMGNDGQARLVEQTLHHVLVHADG